LKSPIPRKTRKNHVAGKKLKIRFCWYLKQTSRCFNFSGAKFGNTGRYF
jgi:hypothetical protein